MFSRWKYRQAAAVVAISTKVREVLLQSGIPSEKIHLIPSGVDFKRYLDVRPLSKESFGFVTGRIIVGRVAALAPHKDQVGFLKAISILKKKNIAVGAVLVGDGPLRGELEEGARQLDLAQDVKFVGYQERPLDYLAAFDIFLPFIQSGRIGNLAH
jgi:glycosyltransferase EpsF